MLTQLKPGNTVYVLEQSDNLSINTGRIVNVTPSYTGNVDMEVKVNDQTYKFQQVPFNQSVVKNDLIIVGETKDQILTEVKKIKVNKVEELHHIRYIDFRWTRMAMRAIHAVSAPAHPWEVRKCLRIIFFLFVRIHIPDALLKLRCIPRSGADSRNGGP